MSQKIVVVSCVWNEEKEVKLLISLERIPNAQQNEFKAVE